MKRFVTIVALTCALCVSAHAGNIPMTGPAPVEPPQTTSIVTTIVLTILSLAR
jgi:hypothetical protein